MSKTGTYLVKHQQTRTYAVAVQASSAAEARRKALRKRSKPIATATKVLDVWRQT